MKKVWIASEIGGVGRMFAASNLKTLCNEIGAGYRFVLAKWNDETRRKETIQVRGARGGEDQWWQLGELEVIKIKGRGSKQGIAGFRGYKSKMNG